ncbi:cysteine desulfurase [Streptomyces sp. DvalAA-14]|uniref:cysteine desulfurase family protein n=1 Tax=unclassified Streptomyces TaxID=2593676 RepID=UPI00081B0F61|nr:MULTISPECIES: cysteine desulfurase family protein [unclassified Streptomyces]MYS23400.1 aminotransferase class V-fold PLP-dependent enzyme [Streptomyces sp. SID4948]SCE32668.1 cysteine desulfurase [Streptomyces sp. DvalAA-14]
MITAPIYLDHQATTPLDERVLAAMLPFFTNEYGNPSSPHAYGRTAAQAIRTARRRVADLVGAKNELEIVFTSGATEANHLAIVGAALATRPHGGHIVTTAIEHKAVLAACQRLVDHHGYTVTRLGVDRHGSIRPADVAAALTPKTTLVTVMHANNEIGTLQQLAAIGKITAARDILLHTDSAQGAGFELLDVAELGVDLASVSGHKLHGPKGIGALYIRGGTPITGLQTGGGQERGLRAGTPNVPAIVGFGTAAHLITSDAAPTSARIKALRDRLQDHLLAAIPGAGVNGHPHRRLPGNLSLTLPGIEAADLLDRIPGIAASTGSACNTGSSEPSHVLTAIGLTRNQARATLRLSIGRTTTENEVDQAADLIARTVKAQSPSAARQLDRLPQT